MHFHGKLMSVPFRLNGLKLTETASKFVRDSTVKYLIAENLVLFGRLLAFLFLGGGQGGWIPLSS